MGVTRFLTRAIMTKAYSTFDQEELDREYSPSSCVEDIDVFLDEYVRLSQAAKKEAISEGTCKPDLRYGSGHEETLDLFSPHVDGPAPLHVFIHGGYWQLLSKDESCFAAPMFQNNGSYFAATNYTLAPHQTLSGIVEENRRAIVWLYSQADKLGFDRNRIFLSGSSAGAHLAMMMLLTDWTEYGLPENTIKGVCAISGVFDLEPVALSYVNDVVGMDTAEALLNSPIRHSVRNRCPVILTYGDNETNEFKRQTKEYRDALVDDGLPVVFGEVNDRNHFDVVLELTKSDTWLAQQVLGQMGLS